MIAKYAVLKAASALGIPGAAGAADKAKEAVTDKLKEKATEKEAQIVNQTIDKIVELKSEVNELKKELNSIHSDTSVKFKLLPISDN